jgi:hypothetical protein
MATKKIAQGTRATKSRGVSQRATVARKEKPVSEGIRRAAERAGIRSQQTGDEAEYRLLLVRCSAIVRSAYASIIEATRPELRISVAVVALQHIQDLDRAIQQLCCLTSTGGAT